LDEQPQSPLNPLPMVVWALVLPMIAMEVVLSAGAGGLVGGPAAIGWRVQAVQMFGFVPDYLRQMIEARQFPLDGLARLVTYPFVSMSTTTTLFVVVITLALGKFVGEVFRWWAILILFFAGVIAGALAYTAVPGAVVTLVGGYPGVYGLIGGFTYVLWRRQRLMGQSQIRAFQLIGFLLVFRIVIGVGSVVAYGPQAGTGFDWVAELAGFVAGFVLSFVVSPGGWASLLARIRAR
jgi:membrane associated rhomboid family serine protease